MTLIRTLLGKYVLCLILYVFCFLSANGATYNRLYGIESLSSNLISSICQDSQGYIWIATEYGLNRFDGVYFTQYYAGGVEGLANNDVSKLLADDEFIYVMMSSKVQVYSYKDNKFYDVKIEGTQQLRFKDMIKTPDGDIWIINSGEGILQVDCKSLVAYPLDTVNRNFKMPHVGAARIDTNHRLWINANDGSLQMYDVKSGKSYSYFDDKSSVKYIAGIMEDNEGRIAVATNNDGIYLLNPLTGVMEYVCDTPNMTIVRTYSNSKGDMIFGTDRRGVWRVNIDSRCVEPVYSQIDDVMPKTRSWAFCEDKDGNSWIGFHSSGVLFISRQQQPFNFVDLSSIENDNGRNMLTMACLKNGNLLVCQAGGGVKEITQGGKTLRQWMHGIGINSVLPIGRDSLIIGTSYNRGVGVIDMSSGKMKWIDALGVLDSPIKGICRDKNGNYYIAEFGKGLYSLTPDMKNKRQLCGGMMRLHNRYFNILTTDSRGLVWIGHHYGFDVYDPSNDRVLQIKTDSLLRGAITYAIAEGSDHTMWLGTSRGLFRYDLLDKEWKRYTRVDGLPNDVVCGIVDSKDGYLWVSTLRGLCRLDLETGVMNNFYAGNGLEAYNYLRGAYAMSSYGTVFLGNERGFTYFTPSSVRAAGFHRGVTLTGVYFLSNKLVTEGDEIRLNYLDNTFTLRFSTMDFREADNIYYEYRFLDEQDKVWHRTSAGVSEITLTHLYPGHQELLVRACDGGVKSDIKKIEIRITPPWWLSWWAYVLYTIASLSVLALIFISYKRKQQAEHNESEIRFLIDVGHELRSPLTLIKSPLELLISHGYDSETNHALQVMKRNTDRMLQLVNQILSIRRIEKGQKKLHFAETDMSKFIHEIVMDYEYEAGKRSIKLEFSSESTDIMAYIDRDHFDKVVNNLLTNAFKYTADGGVISVLLGFENGNVKLIVRDNGQGIDENQIKRIFDRFYQVSGTASGNLGFGIGLNLTYKLVKLHGGEIMARNRADGIKGSEFIVLLRQGLSHLPKNSIVDNDFFMNNTGTVAIRQNDTYEYGDDIKKRKVRSKTSYRIAVVDDDEGIRGFLKSKLENEYRVDVYENGLEALEAITDTLPDLVVSDVMMPQLDGFTLLRRLKNNTRTSHIPVVLLTTKIEHQSHLEGLDYGADAYFDKPFNLEELRASIASLIENRNRVKGKFSGMQEQKDTVRQIELKGNDAQLMEKVMKIVNERLSDSNFTVEELADAVGLSRVQLHRRVKDITGIAIGEFVRNLRMQQAAKLLEQGDVTVAQVTYAVGMVNPNNFAVAFKKYFGVTPSEYMAKYSKNSSGEADVTK